jgi:hypothetical protein
VESTEAPQFGIVRVVSILPEDPLVRWIIWLAVAISIGAPLLAALVLAVTQ